MLVHTAIQGACLDKYVHDAYDLWTGVLSSASAAARICNRDCGLLLDCVHSRYPFPPHRPSVSAWGICRNNTGKGGFTMPSYRAWQHALGPQQYNVSKPWCLADLCALPIAGGPCVEGPGDVCNAKWCCELSAAARDVQKLRDETQMGTAKGRPPHHDMLVECLLCVHSMTVLPP